MQGRYVDDRPVINFATQGDDDLVLEIKQLVNKIPGFGVFLFERRRKNAHERSKGRRISLRSEEVNKPEVFYIGPDRTGAEALFHCVNSDG